MQSLNIIFTEPGKVELREQPVRQVGEGQILCAAQKSLISIGTETRCLVGNFDPGTMWEGWVRYPFHPGYSMSARVMQVGPGVDDLREGDLVAVSTPHRQYFVSDAKDVRKLPEGISDEEGTWMFLGCTTQLAVRRAEIKFGESAGVIGLGMLGQLIVQYLAVSGARHVIALNRRPHRVEMARSYGATHAYATDVLLARTEIERITNGKLLDVVFDVSGHPSVLSQATQLVRRLGRVVLVGDSTEPSQQAVGPRMLANSLSILAVHGSLRSEPASAYYPWGEDDMIDLFFEYVRQGRMNVAKLITHRVSPHEAPEVYADLIEGQSEVMGVIFDWTRL